MSGFEIAGVILGAIPILIVALDQCKKRQIGSYGKTFGEVVKRLQTELRTQQYLIGENIGDLLRAVGYEESLSSSHAFRDLLEANRNLSAELELKFGEGYDIYKSSLEICHEQLLGLARSIKGLLGSKKTIENLSNLLDSDAYNTSKGTFGIRSRLKFLLNYDEIQRYIQDLERSASTLDKVCKRCIDLRKEPIKSSSSATRNFAKFLRQVRLHANTLYLAISDSWLNTCHPVHRTHFFLENRSDLLTGKRKRPEISFKLVFESSKDRSLIKLQYPVDVGILQQESFAALPATSTVPSIRFNIYDDDSSVAPSVKVIDCICSFIQQAQTSNNFMRIFLYEQRLSRQSQDDEPGSYPTANPHEDSKSWITLKEVLQQDLQWRPIPRAIFAFKLASSLLQLYSTPWLPAYWNKEHIWFPQTSNGGFLSEKPFVQASFDDRQKKPLPSEIEDQFNARRPLLELGITLLELWHRKSLDTYISENEIKPSDIDGPRLNAAKHWLAQDDVLYPYRHAVECCIECCLNTNSTFPNWQDNAFQESVCDSILKPLWTSCGGNIK